MNWKDNAHLFANGKFKCEIVVNSLKKSVNDTKYITDIIGISNGKLVASVRKYEHKYASIYPYNITKLVARKIEDMGNHELSGSFSDEFDGRDFLYWKNRLIDIANSGTKRMNVSNFLHLLSIGVYPFDQSHFETGEVIDINTINKEE